MSLLGNPYGLEPQYLPPTWLQVAFPLITAVASTLERNAAGNRNIYRGLAQGLGAYMGLHEAGFARKKQQEQAARLRELAELEKKQFDLILEEAKRKQRWATEPIYLQPIPEEQIPITRAEILSGVTKGVIPPAAIDYETGQKIIEQFLEAQANPKRNIIPVPADTRLIDVDTGEVFYYSEPKEKPQKGQFVPIYDTKTGRQQMVWISEGSDYKPPEGWRLLQYKKREDGAAGTAGIAGIAGIAETVTPRIEQQPPIARDVRKGTGPYAYAVELINKFLGFFPGKEFQSETEEARARLRLLQNRVREALVISSRPSQWEQQQVLLLTPDPNRFLVNPMTELRKLNELRRHLIRIRESNTEAIKSGLHSKQHVAQYQKSNKEINEILDIIGPAVESLKTDQKPLINPEEEKLLEKYLGGKP